MKGRLLLAWLIAIGCWLPTAIADEPADRRATVQSVDPASRAGETERSAEIDALIERLGHPDYPERARAHAELAQMGLMAFDALYAAQFHLDNEVATAARRLISSLRVSWTTESDTREVQEILKDFGVHNEAERKTIISRLGQLEDRSGLPALCRLVRYETSLRLSRDAALEIMRYPVKGATASARQDAQTADQLIEALGGNQRQAAQWLRLYAQDLKSGLYAIQPWREAIALEREAVEGIQSQHTDAATVLELVRVCAVRAKWAGQNDEAMRLAESTLDLIRPARRELIDAANWALESDLAPMVLALRERHSERFTEEPLLQYAAAETYARIGEPERAAQLSQAALAIEPLPDPGSQAAKTMSPDEKENIAYRHREVGRMLEARGRFQWAINEYQHIVDSLAVDVDVAATTRQQLARLQGDLLRHQAVVDTLEPLAERLRSDNSFARRIQSLDLMASQVLEDLAFHQAMVTREQGDLEKTHRLFELAYTHSGRLNADTLISMYRTPGDAEWKQHLLEEIDVLVSHFEQQIRKAEQNRRRGGRPIDDEELARSLNQYAWLVANTVGNHHQALQYSVRSLQLSPDDPMLLDTCARCYFAVGQLDKAVAMQRRAVELMPHQPPMERQLEEFMAARQDAAADEASTTEDGKNE